MGSLSLGRLGPRELIEEYIKHNQAEQAVNFVNSINWNADGNSCFVCLSAVMNFLLKSPLTDDREGWLLCFNSGSNLVIIFSGCSNTGSIRDYLYTYVDYLDYT